MSLFLQTILAILGSVATITLINPAVLVYMAPAVWMLLALRRKFTRTRTELSRIEAVGKQIYLTLCFVNHAFTIFRNSQDSTNIPFQLLCKIGI